MKITINENSSLSDTEIIINCKSADENVLKIIASLRVYEHKLTGTKDNKTYIIDSDKVLYCDTVDKKTFIYTQNEVYETQLRLYELEEKLSSNDFFRASKSTVINLAKIKSFMPDFGGRLEVTLDNGERLNISRQYVPYIKQKLSL
ncbi:MAG: LytTR family DNA-binding domain-containing protein [Oscillospiraceae bacterium]